MKGPVKMNISFNDKNTSFKAERVLTTKRLMRDGRNEILDIFKLNYNTDKFFAEKCNHTLAVKEPLQGKFRKLKNFFVKFLDDKNSRYKSHFIAIRDGEQIVGTLASGERSLDGTIVLTATSNVQEIKSALRYAQLDSDQKSGQIFIGPKDSLVQIVDDAKALSSRLKYLEAKYENASSVPNVKFKTVEDNNGYDLNDFLDINHFETNIIEP